MSTAIEELVQPEWEVPEGWRYWDFDPPKEGERVVRRTVTDMETTFSEDKFMQWNLVQGAFRHGGGFRYMWQALDEYLNDPEERIIRSCK